MSRYAKRLDRDLARWREAGWLNAQGEAAIRQDVAAGDRNKLDLATALAILGAVLIGFGVMSFVAANWSEMPRLWRLVMIFAGLFASYGIAGALYERNHSNFADAAVLAGVAIFGAGIMLISQMFHIEGNPPDAVLVWAIGALAAGVLLRSNAALAVALLLVCLWSGWQRTIDGSVHWSFLLGWLAVTAAIAAQRWVGGLHLAAVALTGWIISLGYSLLDGSGGGHGVVVVIGLLVFGAGVAMSKLDDGRLHGWVTPTIGYGLVIAFAGLFAMQFIEGAALNEFIVLAVAALALVLGGIALGLQRGSSGLLWLGYAGFSIEVLGLYFKTVGTLFGSSLFFLTVGFVVVLLAYVAYRLHARVHPNLEAAR
ncbi:hypothetical protein APY04_0423 [Hyphomicrobium sulfonivorans]|uniref:DUF2157 domain-containing protein n=1 Tax=Hyphomicrobium sulfonivorans TaxID=121290 RepID=A0A109BN75_HYPSL|nr:DUF2157 domain-containing protein [Hyphomicrobium sulfonivorans]KWT71570.1 hypothetical protein APY04_0423 [Hyphomicrobium sulfonivorans]